MIFATAQLNGKTFIGIVTEDGHIMDLQKAEKKLFEMETIPADMTACIEQGEKLKNHVLQLQSWLNKSEETESFIYPLKDVQLLAPIPRPNKNIYCVGKNYRDHAIEMGSEADIPEYVMLFSKAPTSVIGPGEKIDPHLHITNELDYEGELAVIIGKKGKGIPEEEAMDYVFGYTVLNDVTARNLQSRHKQFLLGKSLDTSCPMGPYIVHKSAVEDPYSLKVETRVNGELRQSGETKDMIFSIEKVISVISQGTTLEPGDVIATGTPSGVGKGFNPPKFLQSGDEIEIVIEGVGTLKNQVK
ncbi:fumarylacetoacetate hydrolase family protein [Metabacillus sp. GX 13764]|uniref:fumarylacetoacetate hydrolase family protein n=1 Tax=Metabacillus kandeliae TaxID=2900151 RepID=UPI001E3C72AE|nr:fumarylacetoacetate hydrolase family protein [Metabacillus kandeliae]MCD7034906.1 fumarylacetoacetate hydrolase family protein [Metabacillus kandeliae]